MNLIRLLSMIVFTAAFTVRAESEMSKLDESFRAEIARLARSGVLDARRPAPNAITRGGKTFSGILVQLRRAAKPLQLLNPAAPAEEYGTAVQNVVLDPITRRARGLKLFSVSF